MPVKYCADPKVRLGCLKILARGMMILSSNRLFPVVLDVAA